MAGVSWRRVLARDIEAARSDTYAWTRDPDLTAALERTDDPWHGPTTVVLENGVLQFEGEPQLQVELSSVRSVVRRGHTVWMRRHAAPGWLVRCLSERDAVSLSEAIRAGAAVV